MKFKRFLMYLVCIILGLLVGQLVAILTQDSSTFSWLSYTPPINIGAREFSLVIIRLTFGLKTNFNIAQIIFVIISIFLAPRVLSLIVQDE